MNDDSLNEANYVSLDAIFSQESVDEQIDGSIPTEEAVVPEAPVLTEGMMNYIQNPPFVSEMIKKIEEVDLYAWNRGTTGLDFGFENLNKAFNGLNTGLMLFAGGSNTGKSAVLLQLMWQIIKKNQHITEDHPKKAFCLYFSLDDSNNELMPRVVAIDQKMQINQVLFPKSHEKEPIVMQKREEGIQQLKENVRYFAMKDANDGSSIEHIERSMHSYQEQLEMMAPGEYRLVVFIDNFHDITVETPGYAEDNARFDYVSGRLNELAIEYDAPMICSAEFRKINTNKRPNLEDIKSTGKITYEAKSIVLVFNEVGVKEGQAEVYWEMTDSTNPDVPRKMPVFEMHIAKNKFSSYKGRQFLRFVPEMASFFEVPPEEAQLYQQMMKG